MIPVFFQYTCLIANIFPIYFLLDNYQFVKPINITSNRHNFQLETYKTYTIKAEETTNCSKEFGFFNSYGSKQLLTIGLVSYGDQTGEKPFDYSFFFKDNNSFQYVMPQKREYPVKYYPKITTKEACNNVIKNISLKYMYRYPQFSEKVVREHQKTVDNLCNCCCSQNCKDWIKYNIPVDTNGSTDIIDKLKTICL